MFRKKSRRCSASPQWLQEEVLRRRGRGTLAGSHRRVDCTAVGTAHEALAMLRTILSPVVSFMSSSPNSAAETGQCLSFLLPSRI